MAEVLEKPMRPYVGRLAPSPTGALHLGNVRTFMIAWLRARSLGGRVIFRMEDLDHPKDKPGAAAQAVEDLRWLGFDWDEEYVQSKRKHIYRAALESLLHPSSLIPLPSSTLASARGATSRPRSPRLMRASSSIIPAPAVAGSPRGPKRSSLNTEAQSHRGRRRGRLCVSVPLCLNPAGASPSRTAR